MSAALARTPARPRNRHCGVCCAAYPLIAAREARHSAASRATSSGPRRPAVSSACLSMGCARSRSSGLLRKDLSGRASIAHTCRLDHGHPEDVAVGGARVARTQTCLDQQRLCGGAVAPLEALLNRDRTRDRRRGAVKSHHHAIPRVLHLTSAGLADGLPQQLELLLSQLLGNERSDSGLQLRGAHQVGDQDRDGLNARAAHAPIIPPFGRPAQRSHCAAWDHLHRASAVDSEVM